MIGTGMKRPEIEQSLPVSLLNQIVGVALLMHEPPRKVVQRIKQGHGQLFEPCRRPIAL
jgi:hypothetical protein